MQKYYYCKNKKARKLKCREKKSLPPPVCHLTNVTFQVSHVTYHRSHNIITTKLLKLASCNCKTVVITPCVFMSNIMCHMSPVTHQMSHVTYHMWHVICHMSHVTCRMSHVICSCFFGVVRGVGQTMLHQVDGGSVIHWAHPVYFWFELLSWSTVILLTVLRILKVLHIKDSQRYQIFTSLRFAHF